MEHAKANAAALQLFELLEPDCERLEIAGSLRRQRPQVGDIELVLQPKMREVIDQGAQFALGETEPPSREEPAAMESLRWLERDNQIVPIKSGTAGRRKRDHKPSFGLAPDAMVWRFWLNDPGIVTEICVMTPAKWGLGLMVRTGSAEFVKGMYGRWKRLEGGQGYGAGGRWINAKGDEIDTPEERDVFEAAGLDWLDPTSREYSIERRSLR
jgi:DNA polymerase/3'-5' exonuclease PolX